MYENDQNQYKQKVWEVNYSTEYKTGFSMDLWVAHKWGRPELHCKGFGS